MEYYIYFLINEMQNKTYVGFTDNLKNRIKQHRNKEVYSTKNFGNFKAYLIDKAKTPQGGRKKEKYWKSSAGRKKLKKIFDYLTNL